MIHSLNQSRCDVNAMSTVKLLTQRISPVFTTLCDKASWVVRVFFFKVDVCCRPSGILTERLSCMFTPRELLASHGCHWHLCFYQRFLQLFGLFNDAARKRNHENKVLTVHICQLCLLHILWADPSDCVTASAHVSFVLTLRGAQMLLRGRNKTMQHILNLKTPQNSAHPSNT